MSGVKEELIRKSGPDSAVEDDEVSFFNSISGTRHERPGFAQ